MELLKFNWLAMSRRTSKQSSHPVILSGKSVRFYFTVNLPITQKTSTNYDYYYYYFLCCCCCLLSPLSRRKLLRIKGNDLALLDACVLPVQSFSAGYARRARPDAINLPQYNLRNDNSPGNPLSFWAKYGKHKKPTDEPNYEFSKWINDVFEHSICYDFIFCRQHHPSIFYFCWRSGDSFVIWVSSNSDSEFMAFNLSRRKTL